LKIEKQPVLLIGWTSPEPDPDPSEMILQYTNCFCGLKHVQEMLQKASHSLFLNQEQSIAKLFDRNKF
jgi:hypothetical protein